jgi:hypothetical protein
MTRSLGGFNPEHVARLALRSSAERPAPEPERPAQAPPCELCGGTGWAQVPDPLFGGALVDCRCPACNDLTVRAEKRRWEGDRGERSGPR